MTDWTGKHVLVIGGSSGLGLSIAEAFHRQGAEVAIAARDSQRLSDAAARISDDQRSVTTWEVDLCEASSINALVDATQSRWGHLDVLVNSAGVSDRGRIEDTSAERFLELFHLNCIGTLRSIQGFLSLLLPVQGSVVNIGSLASKTAHANLGAYPVSKFPVAALSEQLRREFEGRLHVLLVCPGPIKRPDAGHRYSAENVPASALKPGGGVRLHHIDPQSLSAKIILACERKRAEVVVPTQARWLFAISAVAPNLGDWLLRRMTSH